MALLEENVSLKHALVHGTEKIRIQIASLRPLLAKALEDVASPALPASAATSSPQEKIAELQELLKATEINLKAAEDKKNHYKKMVQQI